MPEKYSDAYLLPMIPIIPAKNYPCFIELSLQLLVAVLKPFCDFVHTHTRNDLGILLCDDISLST